MLMKRLSKTLFLTLTLLTMSCEEVKYFNAYIDNYKIVDGSLEVSFTEVGGYSLSSSGNYSLMFSINLTNRAAQPYSFNLKEKTIVRESNNATYSVGSTFVSSSISLECDIKNEYLCTVTLPTSISSENYYLRFLYNDSHIVFHFYNSPEQ